MPVSWRTAFLALLLAPAAVVRAQVPTEPPAAAPSWREDFALTAGWGYYEAAHLGVSYAVTERAAVSLLGGYGLAQDSDASVGAVFSHALFGPRFGLQPGWNLKAIYWTQSDESYDWKNLSFVLGAFVAKDLGRGLRLALDGGVALTAALESDRKQDFTFGSPERWNGSVCLEISYRLGGP